MFSLCQHFSSLVFTNFMAMATSASGSEKFGWSETRNLLIRLAEMETEKAFNP